METPSTVIKRDQLCKAAGTASERIHTTGIGKFSNSWFPSQPQPMTFQIVWNINDIKKAMFDIPKQLFPNGDLAPTKFFEPVMVACIAYRSSFTDTEYHTGYILILTDTKTSKYPIFMEQGEIPAKDLKFVYDPSFGVFAD